MFPGRYFNPRYWASRFWAKVGQTPPDVSAGCLEGVLTIAPLMSAKVITQPLLSGKVEIE